MLHDLLDKKIYEATLIAVDGNEIGNKKEVIKKRLNCDGFKEIERLIVQKTSNKGIYQEIITGILIPAYETIDTKIPIIPSLIDESWIIHKYPNSPTCVLISKDMFKVANTKASLERLKEYYKKHQNVDEFAEYLNNLFQMNDEKFDREFNLFAKKVEDRENKKQQDKEELKQLLRTIENNRVKN